MLSTNEAVLLEGRDLSAALCLRGVCSIDVVNGSSSPTAATEMADEDVSSSAGSAWKFLQRMYLKWPFSFLHAGETEAKESQMHSCVFKSLYSMSLQ